MFVGDQRDRSRETMYLVADRTPSGPRSSLGLRTQRIDGWFEIVPAGWAYAFDDDSNANVSGYTSLDGISFRVP